MAVEDSNDKGGDNSRKIHVSRIPTSFNEETVKRILEETLGSDTVEETILIYKRPDGENEGDEQKDNDKKGKKEKEGDEKEHRGFGFVTFATDESYQEAIKLQSIRGGRKTTSSRKHTLYLRPYTESEDSQNVCFLWTQHRCPYGTECKFNHPPGKGGLLVQTESKKKKKCFQYKKTGKCSRKDCPFAHDFEVEKPVIEDKVTETKKRLHKEKDCIDWKTKGRCKKHEKDKCPYRHDEAVREACIKKKKRKMEAGTDGDGTKSGKKHKQRQPLWVRVFGMNYETKELDIREFLQHCGAIMEIQFPTFEDSGRSKGYCGGVLFHSPKAVAKAVELDGEELMGRWLRIQAGKMLLDQWEEREARSSKEEKEVTND